MNAKDLKNLRAESIRIIKDYQKKKSIATTPLAIEIGIHPAQLLKFLRGERGLTDSTLMAIGNYISKNK